KLCLCADVIGNWWTIWDCYNIWRSDRWWIGIIFLWRIVKKLRKFFPPLVTGTVIFTIGLSLYSVAVGYMAGGQGSATFGSMANWFVAIITLLIVTYLTYFTKGFTKLSAIL